MEYESLTYPPYGAPLIEAYSSRFESVFVLLHPFVRVPEHLAWSVTRKYPSDEQILAHGAKRTWSSIAAKTGVSSCAKMNQALLTSIRSLKDEFCDFPAAEALLNHVTSQPEWMPGEGRFEPLLQADHLSAFELAGFRKLVFVPEFPQADPIQQLPLAALTSRETAFPSRGSLVAPDTSFLFTVDWDSFFTLFYGPREFVAQVVNERSLEGFFATPTTDHAWYNYSLGCCVVTLAPDGWQAV